MKNELKSFGIEFSSYSYKVRYKLLPMVIKLALLLEQTNAESEHSLSVNARVVIQDRTLLNEETIVDLRVIKEAVRFSDPIYHQSEKIVITEELKRSVRVLMVLIRTSY